MTQRIVFVTASETSFRKFFDASDALFMATPKITAWGPPGAAVRRSGMRVGGECAQGRARVPACLETEVRAWRAAEALVCVCVFGVYHRAGAPRSAATWI